MVQEFHVVRCFKCESFQVQQVKKVKRWSCKLCGEKQSLLKEFGRGSGADCRRHVQKLNAMRGAVEEEQDSQAWALWEQAGEVKEEQSEQVTQSHVSRWNKYLDPPEGPQPEENNIMKNREKLHGPNTSARKRKSSYEPDQPTCSAPDNVGLQAKVRPTDRNQSSPTTLRTNNLKKPSPCSQNQLYFPSKKPGPISKWTSFLGSDSPVQELGRPSISGIGVTDHSHSEISKKPLLCVSSMFESGENFSFDDDF